MRISNKLNLVKTADAIAGGFLCLTLTIYQKIFFLKQRRGLPGQPRKILLIKVTEMGAIILSYPLMRHLQERYPACEIHFLTLERNCGIFEVLGGIVAKERIWTIDERFSFRSLKKLGRVLKQIRNQRFDVVIDLEFFSRFTAGLSFFSGAPTRLGFHKFSFEGLDRGDLLTHKMQYNPLLHVSKLYLSMAQMLAYPLKSSPEMDRAVHELELSVPSWAPAHEVREAMRRRLAAAGVPPGRRVVLVNPGEGSIPLREWPLENFHQVTLQILNDVNSYVILVGEKGDNGKDERLAQMVSSNRCLNWTGTTSLPELLTLFELADSLLINDCGLGHLASLARIKTFILFGPESPQVFAPVQQNQHLFYAGLPCSPCLSVLNNRQTSCRDNRCLKTISPEDVLKAMMGTPTFVLKNAE